MHAEIFWNPTGSASNAEEYANCRSGILAAIQDAQADCGITAVLIPSIDREAPPEAAMAMVEWMAARPHEKATGCPRSG